MIEPLNAIGLGILAFLAAWAAKHFLDRLVLPHVMDLWARLNKQRAANRAEVLLKQFESERMQASDGRYLTLVQGNRLAYIVSAVGIFCTLLILIAIGQLLIPEAERTKTTNYYLLLLVPLFFVFLLVNVYYSGRRLVSAFTDPNKHRDDIIARVTPLLAAAGLSEDEIKVWLEKVPPISAL